MKFNSIGFNADHWKAKTEAEFVAGESHHGLTKEQLKEAYSLINPKSKKVVKNQPVDTGAADQKAEERG